MNCSEETNSKSEILSLNIHGVLLQLPEAEQSLSSPQPAAQEAAELAGAEHEVVQLPREVIVDTARPPLVTSLQGVGHREGEVETLRETWSHWASYTGELPSTARCKAE